MQLNKVYKKIFGYIFCILDFIRFEYIIKYIAFYCDVVYTNWILHRLGCNSSNILIKRYSSFYGLSNIYISNNCIIEKHCCIETNSIYNGKKYNPEIRIGNNVHLGEYNHITAIHSIIIKDGVLTGRRVTISDNNHGQFSKDILDINPSKRELSSKGSVIIKENVWIGENACILSGVTIGKGCIVAANAVVTQNIPDYCLVAGVPAKIIKQITLD